MRTARRFFCAARMGAAEQLQFSPRRRKCSIPMISMGLFSARQVPMPLVPIMFSRLRAPRVISGMGAVSSCGTKDAMMMPSALESAMLEAKGFMSENMCWNISVVHWIRARLCSRICFSRPGSMTAHSVLSTETPLCAERSHERSMKSRTIPGSVFSPRSTRCFCAARVC